MPANIQHDLHFDTENDIPKVKGFQEVVFSVKNLEKQISIYKDIAGWRVIHYGMADDSTNVLWQVGKEVKIEEAILQNEGDHKGFLRLVRFNGVEQEEIRPNANAWDTGGIFDINMRTKDLQAAYENFQAAGWKGLSMPKRYQFGKFDVSEILVKGDHGITLAMMQRHAPPLEGFPNLRKLSHIFNSTHVAKDIEITLDFFLNKLGFKIYMQTLSKERKAEENILGIPPEKNAAIELPVYIVHPEGSNLGSVEFIQLRGLEGEDFSDRAVPPNLGILMLRFPVSNAMAYAKELESKGVVIHSKVQEIQIEPYGRCKIFVVRSPDGVWLEFLELMQK